MIKHIEIEGLNGRQWVCCDLHNDLNILTGKNGAGKTTLLKLLWYMMSANRELILSEISFKRVLLITDRFRFSIQNVDTRNSFGMIRSDFFYQENAGFSMERQIVHENGVMSEDDRSFLGELNRRADYYSNETIFFPTFRRIEGGFAIDNRRRRFGFGHSVVRSLSDGLDDYSRAMSSLIHTFVASISTADIEELLTREYADISEKTNSMYLDFSRFIRTRLGGEMLHEYENNESALKFRADIKKDWHR